MRTPFIFSVAVIASILVLAPTLASAYAESDFVVSKGDYTPEGATTITDLMNKANDIEEKLLSIEFDKKGDWKKWEKLTRALDKTNAKLAELGFYPENDFNAKYDKYVEEKSQDVSSDEEETTDAVEASPRLARSGSSTASVCPCGTGDEDDKNKEIAYRAAFFYNVLGYKATAAGSYVYLTDLSDTGAASTATVGSLVPDKITPAGQAWQTDTASGDLYYNLELQNSNGLEIKSYGPWERAVTSTSYWYPTSWEEAEYTGSIGTGTKVVMTASASSWN